MRTSEFSQQVGRPMAVIAGIGLVMGVLVCEAQTAGEPVEIPQNATALEGVPEVRIDTTRDGATRRELDAAEAAGSRLTVTIANGRFYWGERDGRPLTVSSSGEFTYLSSTEPGRYVRFRRVNDRLTYVEHVDMAFGSVTYWGELRIVVRK